MQESWTQEETPFLGKGMAGMCTMHAFMELCEGDVFFYYAGGPTRTLTNYLASHAETIECDLFSKGASTKC